MGRSILFTPPEDKETAARCKQKHHFVLGSPLLLKLTGEDVGPIPFFDLVRATQSYVETQGRRPRIVTPFADYKQRLLDRIAMEKRR